MNRILQTLLLIAIFSAQAFAQCNATAQVITASATSSFCVDGNSSYIVRMQSSEVGYEYLLKDTLTGNVITGPLDGNGSAIDFDTRFITRTTTFEIIAQPKASAGNALRFGGGTSDLALNTSGWNFDYSQGYSVEFVFNGNTNPLQFYNGLLSLGSLSISDLEVYFQQAANQLTIVHGRGQANTEFNQYTSPTAFTDVHIAIVFDPSIQNTQERLQVYYDGVSQTRTNTSSFITSMLKTQGSAWRLGNMDHIDFNNLVDACNGTFDELRIWSDARSASEIDANKAGCVSTTEQGLVHYYQFDEGNGSTIADATSSGYDLNILANSGNMTWESELIACASSSSCQVPMANTVTIGDLDAPSLTLSSSLTLDLDASGNATLNLANLVSTASDNCSDSTELSFTANVTTFDCSDLGVNTVFVTVTDESGNDTEVGTIVSVQDATGPTITSNGNTPREFALDANTNQVIITASDLRSTVQDNCDSNPTVTLSKTTFGCTDLGQQTITINARDAQGNTSSATEEIAIVDNTAPTYTIINPSLELDANGAYTVQQSDIVSNISDNCSDLEDIIIALDDTPFSCANLGTFDFNFTITDANGNTANATSSITLLDNIDPVAIAQDLTVDLGQDGTVTVDASQVDNGSSDNCSIESISLDKDTFTNADLGANTVTLTATDQSGNSASATATVTVEIAKTPQTITFPEPDRVVYGASPVTLNAMASSGLSVSYSIVSGPGTIINGNEVEVNGAGDIIIEASQAGNDTFAPATGSAALAVTKATLTATAQDISIVYGSNDFLSFSISYSGFVNGDDAQSLDQVPTAGSTATVASDAGVYDIVVSGGSDDNYDFNRVDGIFTIAKADQTIDFPALTDVDLASGNTIVLSATSNAGLPIGYTLTVGMDIATISATQMTITGTGAITVKATQTGTNNYNPATPVQQTLLATDSRKQDQSITLSSVTNVTYGDAPITLNATASSGLSVTYSYVDGPATLTGNVVTITGAGIISIEVSQDGNDAFNPAPTVTQTITVSKAALTATADNQSINYGDAIPELTYQYTGFVNGEGAADLGSEPTISTSATATSDAGTYTITLAGGEATNYTITLVEASLAINKIDQLISITAIDDKEPTDVAFDVVATVDSGLDLTYEVSGPATIAGSTITLDGVDGTVTVTVSQAGDVNRNAASEQTSFEVAVVLALKDGLSDAISIYPNPVAEYIMIDTNELVDLQFFGLNGQLIKTINQVNGKVDVSELKQGTYLMNVSNASEKITLRIQKAN